MSEVAWVQISSGRQSRQMPCGLRGLDAKNARTALKTCSIGAPPNRSGLSLARVGAAQNGISRSPRLRLEGVDGRPRPPTAALLWPAEDPHHQAAPGRADGD